MPIKVTFGKQIKINGRITSPHKDGNNGRSVYTDGKYIIKIDDKGYHHDESLILSDIEKDDLKYFVPILAEGTTKDGDRWIVQRFLKLDYDRTEKAWEIVSHLVNKYNLFDMDEEWNWAMYKGQPIIFDYGNLGAKT